MNQRALPNILALLFFSVAGCGDYESASESAEQQVASSELYSLGEDFRIWDLLERQNIEDDAVRRHVANSMIRHLLIVRAAKYEISELKGGPIEALCRATTDEARSILERYGDEELRDIALDYIDVVTPETISEVRRVQQSLLGEGCYLSPRSEW